MHHGVHGRVWVACSGLIELLFLLGCEQRADFAFKLGLQQQLLGRQFGLLMGQSLGFGVVELGRLCGGAQIGLNLAQLAHECVALFGLSVHQIKHLVVLRVAQVEAVQGMVPAHSPSHAVHAHTTMLCIASRYGHATWCITAVVTRSAVGMASGPRGHTDSRQHSKRGNTQNRTRGHNATP